MLHKEWLIKMVPEWKGTGVQFYDAFQKEPEWKEGQRKEGEISGVDTTNDNNVQELKDKIRKLECVFQMMLTDASELSALFRKLTIEQRF